MIEIPEFPEAREITLDDKPLIDSLLAAKRPEISAYTFTNMFAWREQHGVRISRIGDRIVAHYNHGGVRTCLEPLGEGAGEAEVREVFSRADGRIEFGYVHAQLASGLRGDDSLLVTQDRDNEDYIYLSQDLIHLTGRKYDAKRNFINRFSGRYDYEYLCIKPELALECFRFAEEWCEDRSCEKVEGMLKEHCAVYQMLMNFGALGIVGGAIRVEGRIVAFALGERVNPDTLVVHVEKADSSMEGLYQVINNEFCIHEASDIEYVNREQDLGVPGLRKAKESYHPVKLVETYRITRA